jgi:hypothetical protein
MLDARSHASSARTHRYLHGGSQPDELAFLVEAHNEAYTRRMRKVLYRSIGLVFMSMALDGGTISSASAILGSGEICSDGGPSSATCSLTAAREMVDIFVTSSYGAVSGSLSGRIEETPVDYVGATFQGAFSDYLVITGGTGDGSLTAIFSVQTNGASYSVIAGTVEQTDHLSATTIPVTSPFTFGAPTRIGGMVQGGVSTLALAPEDHEFRSEADLRLTEIRVFDAVGELVAGASVLPQGADVNFFQPPPQPIPEPNTWMFLAGGMCIIVFRLRFCSSAN